MFQRLVLVWGLTTFAVFAGAASFNCARARTSSEKLICSVPELSAADDRAAAAYRVALASASPQSPIPRDKVRQDQLAWLILVLANCRTVEEMRAAYADRIATLEFAVSPTSLKGSDFTVVEYQASDRKKIPQIRSSPPNAGTEFFNHQVRLHLAGLVPGATSLTRVTEVLPGRVVSTYLATTGRGGTDSWSIAVDLETGKQVHLSELFGKGTPYEERLTRLARDSFFDQLKRGSLASDEAWVARGLDFGTPYFTLTADALLLHFPPNAIAPSSAGDGTARVEYSELADIAEPSGVLAALIPVERPKPPQMPGGTVGVNLRDGQTYVWMPPGTFQMGCQPRDEPCKYEEKPPHLVTISRGFWIGRTSSTGGAYLKVMGSNPSHSKDATLPVEDITWDDARRFCEASGMRLPSEAEWEYTAREGRLQTNTQVLDWVMDKFEVDYYREGDTRDPQGLLPGSDRVVRGGSKIMQRFHQLPEQRLDSIGVRCAGTALPSEVRKSSTGPAPVAVKTNPRDALKYVWIPPATFEMGCVEKDRQCKADERPVHQVTLSRGFWMGQTEVTQDAYQKVMGSDIFMGHNRPQEPVGGISWAHAQEYCEGIGMRLPTEAEWEYGARGPSSDPRPDLDSIAWYEHNSGGEPHPVALKAPNGFGLYDMLGNVWEWTGDRYGIYRETAQTDPTGASVGQYRVVRGGAASLMAGTVRASVRDKKGFLQRVDKNVGFRCAGFDVPSSVVSAATAPRPEDSPSIKLKVNPRDGQPYAWIPPTTYIMGCSEDDTDCNQDEYRHRVTISKGFWIGQTEVTEEVYKKATGINPSSNPGIGKGNFPVTGISWFDSKQFCESIGMRLPTEAEWELAARGPTRVSRAHYGALDSVGWFIDNSDQERQAVAQKPPNGFGLYDMLGNVWEWTADADGDLPRTPQVDPKGPARGMYRVMRGGSWTESARSLRASARLMLIPEVHSNHVGARCAGNLP